MTDMHFRIPVCFKAILCCPPFFWPLSWPIHWIFVFVSWRNIGQCFGIELGIQWNLYCRYSLGLCNSVCVTGPVVLLPTIRHRKRVNDCWTALWFLLLSIPCCIISSLQQVLITLLFPEFFERYSPQTNQRQTVWLVLSSFLMLQQVVYISIKETPQIRSVSPSLCIG